jgi:hypothetical protein
MKTSHLTGLCILLAFFAGCVGDDDLHRTFFIRDKLHPDLPEYSEWGYNTFGAYVNEEAFISIADYWDPASLYADDTTMTLSFHGLKISKGKDSTDMILYFIIRRNSQMDSQYLLSLNDEIIDLKASGRVMILSSQLYPVATNKGEIHFTRVQNLFVDGNSKETILSGTFEFNGIMNGQAVTVTLGRFDVGVNYYQGY